MRFSQKRDFHSGIFINLNCLHRIFYQNNLNCRQLCRHFRGKSIKSIGVSMNLVKTMKSKCI